MHVCSTNIFKIAIPSFASKRDCYHSYELWEITDFGLSRPKFNTFDNMMSSCENVSNKYGLNYYPGVP